jgi:hypothetical protein
MYLDYVDSSSDILFLYSWMIYAILYTTLLLWELFYIDIIMDKSTIMPLNCFVAYPFYMACNCFFKQWNLNIWESLLSNTINFYILVDLTSHLLSSSYWRNNFISCVGKKITKSIWYSTKKYRNTGNILFYMKAD